MKKIKSIRVSDYMARERVTFTPDMRVLDAVNILVKRRISGAPVVDNHGNLVGIQSDIDCITVALHAADYNQAGGRVSVFMTPEVITID
ncbi:MAG: CBS domain-containing protein, partial [Gammaproteobacteria bacterium]